MSTDKTEEQAFVVIEPKKGWQVINFKELWEYKDLFQLMVLRDITVQYKQSVLGFAWAILTPLIQMVVFTAIFSHVAKIDPGIGVPYQVFSFCGLLPWTYFSLALTNSTNSLITATNILTKVYFPRLIIPMTPVLAKLADFFIALVILFIMMAFYGIMPNYQIVFLPLLLFMMILTASGIGLWLSAMAIQYRDIKFAISFLVNLLMYAAPVVWPASKIPHQYRLIYSIYPMGGIIEGFRASLLGKSPMPWDMLAVGGAVSVILFLTGAMYFRRMEKVFADVA
jgi:lipopolysaccharide transport system permease protein